MWPFRRRREEKKRSRLLRSLIAGVIIGSAIGSVIGKRTLDDDPDDERGK